MAKPIDLMVDLETLATGPDACVVQIGACYFDRYTGEVGETFKANILPTSPGNGRIDGNTVQWWMGQSEAARASIFAAPQQPCQQVMEQFQKFASRANAIWSHATFDFVIVQETLKRCGLRTFNYKFARDIRTLVDLGAYNKPFEKSPAREGTHHDALDDAKFQVLYCVEAFKRLGGVYD